ncbi:nitroreductase [Pseudodesulfovibrio sp. JC047]|uniref:nitroreductase family protein n=1 Tax=Pseudodesulfovibrio sp. JC047 TaxID=2683199 RepID=UPI0013D05B81|nr:nitroreductase family protein [Pseudodesulfovibrio sp. JC047]NDV18948.1 nitroreductase [Pseudodesulfovibrio sp. JC047]
MSLFSIDSKKCLKDGACAADCPVGCLVFEAGKIPVPHEKKQAYCLQCGHCVAVCPSGAITLNALPEPGVRKETALRVSNAQGEQFLRSRRSVRTFRDKPIPRETLASLLQTAEYAPSGHNARKTRWAVADSSEAVNRVANIVVQWMRREAEQETDLARSLHLPGIVRVWDSGRDLVCRNAPALAVAFGPKKGITPREDGVLAVSYLDLAATAAGLGGCWCGYVTTAAMHDPELRAMFGVSDDQMVYGSILLGWPVRAYPAVPPRAEPGVRWL